MNPETTFADRLGLALGSRSVESVAEQIGMPASTVRNWRRGPSEPGLAKGIAIAQALDVDPTWLATGAGSMRADQTEKAKEIQGLAQRTPVEEPGDYVMVPRYSIRASAGHGAVWDHENVEDYLPFKASWVRRALGVDPRHLALITATGDSMLPTIRSGDLLLIDTSVDRIRDDAIYVLVRGDTLLVKRLQAFFTGAIAVKSDNPAYAEQTLGPDELDLLRIAGRVRWIATLL